MTNVSVDKRQRMQLIGVTEHLGIRLPASPPPPSPRQPTVVGHRGLKNGHSRPAGRSAKNAAKCGKIAPRQILMALSNQESEAPRTSAGTSSSIGTAPSVLPESFLYCLGHPGLSLRNDGHVKHDMHNKSINHWETYCNWEISVVCSEAGPWGSASSRRKRVKFNQTPRRLKPTCIHLSTQAQR